MIKIILVLILAILLLQSVENFSNYRTSCSTNRLPKLLQKALDERQMTLNSAYWDYYIPCGYNKCEKQVRALKGSNGKKIFMIDGCDSIASKNTIFKTLKNKYGKKACNIMPETFNLREKVDVKRFIEHFKNKRKGGNITKYILKNNRQRQEGLKIVNKISQIKSAMNDKEYYLVQDFLNNPFLLNKRKINLRYYFVIICRNGKIESYIYRNGFMYYTPKFFERNSIDKDRNITTGYIDRQVYVENPLTTQDFREYLGKDRADYFDSMVKEKFKLMTHALKDTICNIDEYPNSTLFQLFGADIAPNEDLDVQFMEINKGPDIGGKDKRDSELKLNMLRGIFNLVDIEHCSDKNINKICRKINYERIL